MFCLEIYRFVTTNLSLNSLNVSSKMSTLVATITAANSPEVSLKISTFGAVKMATKCPYGRLNKPSCWLLKVVSNSGLYVAAASPWCHAAANPSTS